MYVWVCVCVYIYSTVANITIYINKTLHKID